MGPAQHPVAAEILFAGAVEVTSVERTREKLTASLSRVCPTDRSENAVVVVIPVIDPAVALIRVQRAGRDRVIVVLRILADGYRLVGSRI